MSISSNYIFSIDLTKVRMFNLSYYYCETCQEFHPYFEYGSGHRSIPFSEWGYDVIYDSLEE